MCSESGQTSDSSSSAGGGLSSRVANHVEGDTRLSRRAGRCGLVGIDLVVREHESPSAVEQPRVDVPGRFPAAGDARLVREREQLPTRARVDDAETRELEHLPLVTREERLNYVLEAVLEVSRRVRHRDDKPEPLLANIDAEQLHGGAA